MNPLLPPPPPPPPPPLYPPCSPPPASPVLHVQGWSGAEIAGVVRAATARAVQRVIDVGQQLEEEEEAPRGRMWGDVLVTQEVCSVL